MSCGTLFIHETPDPNPGGAGYLVGLNYGASDNLIENNIMWYGNKVNVMRATGGGNVIAYNYMDDSFGSAYPESPEAGVNAGHYTTPHMELWKATTATTSKAIATGATRSTLQCSVTGYQPYVPRIRP